MKNLKYLICVFILSLCSCSVWKQELIKTGDHDTAIRNAIYDYTHTERNSKKYNVFSVNVKDINDNIIGVSIFGDENKLLPNPENKLGSSYSNFPTKFIEYKGKLFYWYDPKQTISNELISILSKYNHIDSLNVNGFIGIPETSSKIDDSEMAVDYFLCKKNLMIYKKIIDRVPLNNYKAIELNCDE
jgi:hypothetical protein